MRKFKNPCGEGESNLKMAGDGRWEVKVGDCACANDRPFPWNDPVTGEETGVPGGNPLGLQGCTHHSCEIKNTGRNLLEMHGSSFIFCHLDSGIWPMNYADLDLVKLGARAVSWRRHQQRQVSQLEGDRQPPQIYQHWGWGRVRTTHWGKDPSSPLICPRGVHSLRKLTSVTRFNKQPLHVPGNYFVFVCLFV